MAKRLKNDAVVVSTKRIATECNLGAQKSMVLAALAEGRSMAETAEMTGVGRRTIYNWLNYDAAFRAAYNQWKNEMEESVRRRLMSLRELALDAIGAALDKGDAKLALQFLKHCKAMAPAKTNRPVTVTEAQQEIELENIRRRTEHEIDALDLGAKKGIAMTNFEGWTRRTDGDTVIKKVVKPGAIEGEEEPGDC